MKLYISTAVYSIFLRQFRTMYSILDAIISIFKCLCKFYLLSFPQRPTYNLKDETDVLT